MAVRVDDETRAAKTSVPFLALIHRSAWKGDSANFAITGF
jgi:hypothetical protein